MDDNKEFEKKHPKTGDMHDRKLAKKSRSNTSAGLDSEFIMAQSSLSASRAYLWAPSEPTCWVEKF